MASSSSSSSSSSPPAPAPSSPVALSLPRPDDWHLHLRDGAPMAAVVAQLAQVIEAAPLHLALAPTEEILLVQQQPTGRQGRGCGFRGQ